jgi:CRISPR/Cas system-associated exonuclease Cas4 (RecB family)
MNDTPLSPSWYFSHSQLSLFQLCPRRYYEVYIQGRREPARASAEFSTRFVHEPLVDRWKFGADLTDEWWTEQWAKVDTTAWPAYATLPTARTAHKQVWDTYPELPTWVQFAERTYKVELTHGVWYHSRPDFVTANFPIDIKFSTARNYPELASFDPQFVGQAFATGKDTFARLLIWLQYGKKKPEVVLEEVPLLDSVLSEWKCEQMQLIEQIRECCEVNVWPKHRSSCGAFGVQCPAFDRCVQGGLS